MPSFTRRQLLHNVAGAAAWPYFGGDISRAEDHEPAIPLDRLGKVAPSDSKTSSWNMEKMDWTEIRQAKWLLRRILSDLGTDSG